MQVLLRSKYEAVGQFVDQDHYQEIKVFHDFITKLGRSDFPAQYLKKLLTESRKINPLLHNESKGKFVVKPKNHNVHA
jgi:hypothetical protein